MATPFETIVSSVQAVSWTSVVVFLVGLLSVVASMAWQARGIIARITKAETHVEKMATNDLPHTFHVLLNIDKNIAKLCNGDTADFTELDAQLKKE